MPAFQPRKWMRRKSVQLATLCVFLANMMLGFMFLPQLILVRTGAGPAGSTLQSSGGASFLTFPHTNISISVWPHAGGTGTTSATPTSATPTSSGSYQGQGISPSGQAMPQGDLPGWHQIFAEDFHTDVATGGFPGTAYGNEFTLYPNNTPDTAGKRGAPSRYYPSRVLSVQNGLLNLYLHTQNGISMGAAVLPVLSNHLYGKYTIRFRSDALMGYKTAWLLWPDSEKWPADGEIDFPEGNLTGTIDGFVHHIGATSGLDQDAFDSGITYTAWHTTSLEWTPNRVTFILDGRVIGTSTTRIPNTPMHWILQTESCLDGCPTSTTAGNLQIDWITAYSLA